jgi:hypothetical protein
MHHWYTALCTYVHRLYTEACITSGPAGRKVASPVTDTKSTESHLFCSRAAGERRDARYKFAVPASVYATGSLCRL